jgi:hypothetical protein
LAYGGSDGCQCRRRGVWIAEADWRAAGGHDDDDDGDDGDDGER